MRRLNAVKALEAIFDKHKNERVCVLGTSCCGKSTLCAALPGALDMDDLLWPTLSESEEKRVCTKPWTREIGDFTAALARERIHIAPGRPLFSLILLDCEVVVYLDISDSVLKKHCKARGAAFSDVKNIREAIEKRWRGEITRGRRACYAVTIDE